MNLNIFIEPNNRQTQCLLRPEKYSANAKFFAKTMQCHLHMNIYRIFKFMIYRNTYIPSWNNDCNICIIVLYQHHRRSDLNKEQKTCTFYTQVNTHHINPSLFKLFKQITWFTAPRAPQSIQSTWRIRWTCSIHARMYQFPEQPLPRILRVTTFQQVS